MASVDQVLNVVMPLLVVLLFGGMLYKRVQEPLDRLFAWIAEMIRKLFNRGRGGGGDDMEWEYVPPFDQRY
tara:strand:+ start:83 stop:295 length:213 start_codon:yes stop_codon:yes gene_type:complete